MKASIVIPAHNEEKRILETLNEYSKYFESIRKSGFLDYEILVVINNTTDKTENIVKTVQKTNKRILYLNFKRGGKGFAVIEGFKSAIQRKNDVIGFVDADMATNPDAFYHLIQNIKHNDGIIAGRYLSKSIISPKPSLARILVSRMFNFSVRSLFLMPYSDTQCGAKVFRRKAIEKTLPSLKFSLWAFDVDLLYHLRKNGFKIKEVPTVWSDRAYSKINFMKAGPMMLLGIFRLRILNSPFKRFIRVYDSLIGMVQH